MKELHGVLVHTERSMPNEQEEHKDILMVRKGNGFKKQTIRTSKREREKLLPNLMPLKSQRSRLRKR